MNVTRIPNVERVARITMNAHALVKCEIGQDWYNCYLEAEFVPGEYYPDYMQVDEFVMHEIDGQEKNIEVVARELYDFLAQFCPKSLKVVNHVRGCKTHSDVDVVIED